MKGLIPVLLVLLGTGAVSAQSIFDSTYARRSASVYFDFGKSDITPAAGAVLDSLVAGVRTDPASMRIRITAHTDSVGSPRANQALSERRAEAVRAALQQRGLTQAQIEVRGLGEGMPAASNKTEEGRQHNRRATLELMAVVPMTTLKGQVKDQKTQEGIPNAMVTFRSKTRMDSTITDVQGNYEVRLPKDSLVKVEAVAKDHFFLTTMIRTFGSPELYAKYKISPDIVLPPALPGEKVVIRDLFFVGNQAVLLPASEPELPKVLRFMQLNPDIRIEIAGHMNSPGVAPEKLHAWQQQLSVDRAKMVYDYLLKNGISAERMRYKGYGNRYMLFPDPKASEGQQQQNRRVEIRVLKDGE